MLVSAPNKPARRHGGCPKRWACRETRFSPVSRIGQVQASRCTPHGFTSSDARRRWGGPRCLQARRSENDRASIVKAGNARRHGFSWTRARVSRSWLGASRSWRSVAGRHAGNARPSSKELHGNTPDGGRAASASESVQSAHTAVPKTAYYARSARESSRVSGSGPRSAFKGTWVRRRWLGNQRRASA